MNARLRQWLLIAVSTLMIFCSVGMTTATFSIYLPYFIKINGFTNSQISFLVSIRTVASFAFMFAITKYFNLFSLRAGMTLAMLGCASSFILMAGTTNYYLTCLAVCILGGTYTFASMYPLTILMNRWFGDKSAVPISISSCGSGIAAIFCPTVVTYVIDHYSLSLAFYMDAVIMALVAALIYAFVRDYPEEIKALGDKLAAKKDSITTRFRTIPKLHFYMLMLAVCFNGSLTLAGWGHYAVLFKTNNYSSMEVAYALSLGGLTLTASKFFYGFVTERIRTFKSNFIFCTLINTGFLLCMLLPLGYSWTPTAIAVFTGLGCPISTLGVCMWTKEISTPEEFPDNLRKLQTCHLFGGLIFSNVPGVLADLTGSYVPSYMLFSLLGIISFTIIQTIYVKNKLYNIYD